MLRKLINLLYKTNKPAHNGMQHYPLLPRRLLAGLLLAFPVAT